MGILRRLMCRMYLPSCICYIASLYRAIDIAVVSMFRWLTALIQYTYLLIHVYLGQPTFRGQLGTIVTTRRGGSREVGPHGGRDGPFRSVPSASSPHS